MSVLFIFDARHRRAQRPEGHPGEAVDAGLLALAIGVGHPRTLALTQEVADFVLHPPSREHDSAIAESIGRALEIVPALVDGKFERAALFTAISIGDAP